MANSWNKPVTPKKPKKPSTPPPKRARHTVDMSRRRKAGIVATEIRKAERKLAERRAELAASGLTPEQIEKHPRVKRLAAHIARLTVMCKRLTAGDPAEVRTARDYARRKPLIPAMTLREAMQIKATTAPAASPSCDEVATVSDPAPVQS